MLPDPADAALMTSPIRPTRLMTRSVRRPTGISERADRHLRVFLCEFSEFRVLTLTVGRQYHGRRWIGATVGPPEQRIGLASV